MFKRKELTPKEQFDKSQKHISKTLKKRDKLDKKYNQTPYAIPDYESKRKKLNRIIAIEIDNKNAAIKQMEHPPKKQTTIKTTVHLTNIENKASIEGHIHIGGKKKN